MTNFKKYLSVFRLVILTRLSADASFRMSFFASLVGSFCFILLYVATILLLMPHVKFGIWGIKEMWLLLGVFLIFCYTIFYFFWRGLYLFPENLRNGQLDFYLSRPIDTQFLVTFLGGGIHNLISTIFGIIVTIWAVSNLNLDINILQLIFFLITLILAILDFYSLVFLFIILNLRVGYLGDATMFLFDFQSFSRYPTEAFNGLPETILWLVMPFSLLTTIPTLILLQKNIPITLVLFFIVLSMLLIVSVRIMWQRSLRFYSSASS